MAKKKRYSNKSNNQPKVEVKDKNNNQSLNKNVDSLVNELEKSSNVPRRQEEKKIEQLESTVDLSEVKKEIEKEIEKEIKQEVKDEIKKVIETPKDEVIGEVVETPKDEVIEVPQKEVADVSNTSQFEPIKEEFTQKIEQVKEESQPVSEPKDDFLDDFSDIKTKNEIEEEKNKDLFKTNSYRFSFDNKRLSDQDSLDTSFLEGRIKNTPKGGQKKKIIKPVLPKKSFKPKIVLPKISKTSHEHHAPSLFVRRLTCAIILIIVSFLLGFAICYRFAVKTQIQIEKEQVIKEVKVADDNYVFLGDSITDFYDLGQYYSGLPVINSGINGNNTRDVLESLNDRVYKYNPSKVFILLGTNDYVSLRRNESIKENITKIVEEIHKNRPLAKIYIESIIPITVVDDECIHYDFIRVRDNKEIEDANEILKKICKEKDATFIDTYSLFYDEREGLKLEYTKDGLHLNDNGYRVLTDELMKYIKA